MKLILKTAPITEPLATDDVKLHCRLDLEDTTEDALLESLIVAARQFVEMWTRRALITQTWQLLLDEWPSESRIELPKPPLQSVTSVTYVDVDGVEYELEAGSYHVELACESPVLNPYQLPGSVVLAYDQDWPSATLRTAAPITIEFVAGYGDTGDEVPAPLRQAMLLLVGHWYENREATVNSEKITEVPLAVRALLAPFEV